MSLHLRRSPGAAPADQTGPVSVTVVESQGCHYCADAQSALTQMIADGAPLEVTLVDARSAEGSALLRRHRVSMMPLVLLDGQFFSQGRLPRRKLSRLLAGRSTSASSGNRKV